MTALQSEMKNYSQGAAAGQVASEARMVALEEAPETVEVQADMAPDKPEAAAVQEAAVTAAVQAAEEMRPQQLEAAPAAVEAAEAMAVVARPPMLGLVATSGHSRSGGCAHTGGSGRGRGGGSGRGRGRGGGRGTSNGHGMAPSTTGKAQQHDHTWAMLSRGASQGLVPRCKGCSQDIDRTCPRLKGHQNVMGTAYWSGQYHVACVPAKLRSWLHLHRPALFQQLCAAQEQQHQLP